MDKSATDWMVEPLRQYAQFNGRARRKEYWWFSLFAALASIPLSVIDMLVMGADRIAAVGIGPFTGIFALALVIPSIAVSIRRMHDLGRSGWWLLIGLVPLIGGLVLLVWYCSRGTIGSNRFGLDPLAGEP